MTAHELEEAKKLKEERLKLKEEKKALKALEPEQPKPDQPKDGAKKKKNKTNGAAKLLTPEERMNEFIKSKLNKP